MATVHVPATSPVDPPLATLAAAPVEAAAVGSLEGSVAAVPFEAAALGAALGRLNAATLSPRRTWS